MSLGPSRWQPAPSMEAYKFREEIPEAERCEYCEGYGSKRLRYSGCFGGGPPEGSHDWQMCYVCDGTGRKKEKL